jgi:hypothetical protein
MKDAETIKLYLNIIALPQKTLLILFYYLSCGFKGNKCSIFSLHENRYINKPYVP